PALASRVGPPVETLAHGCAPSFGFPARVREGRLMSQPDRARRRPPSNRRRPPHRAMPGERWRGVAAHARCPGMTTMPLGSMAALIAPHTRASAVSEEGHLVTVRAPRGAKVMVDWADRDEPTDITDWLADLIV